MLPLMIIVVCDQHNSPDEDKAFTAHYYSVINNELNTVPNENVTIKVP